jgi:hypothetical protein
MKKEYDKVSLDFLFEILKLRGFGDTWLGWIKKIVLGGSVSVMAMGRKAILSRQGKG